MSKCFLAEGCLFLSPTPFLTFCVNAQSVCSQRSGDLTTLEVTLATEVFMDFHVPASWCRLGLLATSSRRALQGAFSLPLHPPYCQRLLISHKATCLSCDVCRHSQLSQRDSCSSSPLWEPRLSLQKLILRGDSTNSVRRARACSHPGVCTAALAHKLPNPTFSRHSGHAPRCQAVSLALCFL